MKSFDPPVVGNFGEIWGNLGKLRARPQKSVAPAMIEALEQRTLLSATGKLTLLAGFNGVDGYSPNSGVADAKGDIFGATLATTKDGGNTFGPGVVFEIPAGSSTVKDLATFPAGASGTVGAIDSSGDVFGVEAGAKASVPDTVFEIPAGTSKFTPLATFPSQFGTQGTVTAADSAGDVFGIAGFPFEVKKGSGAMTALENQNDPQIRFNELLFGPGGNLYGTGTDQNNNPVIADVSPTTGDVTTLATIDFTTIGTYIQGIAIDSSGNIWGLCQYGGSAGQGTVWELPVHSKTVSLIASFTAATGDTPVGPPVFDASGNLYGLTTNDGASGNGTLFEIRAGAAKSGPVVLVGLTSAEQVSTSAGFVTNSAGIAPVINGDELAIFGGLFGAPASASAAIGHVHPNNESPDLFGAMLALLVLLPHIEFSLKVVRPFPNILTDPAAAFQALERGFNAAVGATPQVAAKIQAAAPAVENGEGGPLLARSEIVPLDVQVSPQVKLSASLEAIEKMLETTRKDLKSGDKLVNSQVELADEASAEVSTVDSLQTELAAETNAKSEAKIQKEITADEATATKYAKEDETAYKGVKTAKANISALESKIQKALRKV